MTTKDFAAAVLASDPQGLRILYYSFAPDVREIGIVPWDLEPGGRYRLTYGVDASDDDPGAGGTRLGMSRIPKIEAPVDLEPRTVTVGIHYAIGDEPREIYVVLDPDDEIPNEITTFNNVAHARLMNTEEGTGATPAGTSFRQGRR